MTILGHAAVSHAANVPDLSDGLGGFRLILHVLAATVWVGGQFTVAGLLPTIRALGDDAPKKVAQAFARLLWPAYAVLVVTGFWNISALDRQGRLLRLEGGAGGQDRRGGGGRGGRLPPPAGHHQRAWPSGGRSGPWPRWPRWASGSSWPAEPGHPTGRSVPTQVGAGACGVAHQSQV